MTRPVRFRFISGVQILVVAEQNDANFGFVHIESDAQQAAGELHQFLEPNVRVGRKPWPRLSRHRSRRHFMRCQLRLEGFAALTQVRERLIDSRLQKDGRRGHSATACAMDFAGGAGADVGFGAAFGLLRGLGFQECADLLIECMKCKWRCSSPTFCRSLIVRSTDCVLRSLKSQAYDSRKSFIKGILDRGLLFSAGKEMRFRTTSGLGRRLRAAASNSLSFSVHLVHAAREHLPYALFRD